MTFAIMQKNLHLKAFVNYKFSKKVYSFDICLKVVFGTEIKGMMKVRQKLKNKHFLRASDPSSCINECRDKKQ